MKSILYCLSLANLNLFYLAFVAVAVVAVAGLVFLLIHHLKVSFIKTKY